MRIHKYFKDNCIIQSEKSFNLSGYCNNNSNVNVKFISNDLIKTFFSTSDAAGYFCCKIDSFKASFIPYTIEISDGVDCIEIKNVLFGNVFLGLGQSNLEYQFKYLLSPQSLYEKYKNQKFRILDVFNKKIHCSQCGLKGEKEEQHDFMSDVEWKISDCKIDELFNSSGFSYIFGGEMSNLCNCPIGIVNLAVGGSHIIHWLPEYCFKDRIFSVYKKKVESSNGQNEFGCIYNEKVMPLKGLSFLGAIWYLGESIAFDGYQSAKVYKDAFAVMKNLYSKIINSDLKYVIVDIQNETYEDEYAVNYVNEANQKIEEMFKDDVVDCPVYDLSKKWIVENGNKFDHPIHIVDKSEYAKRCALLMYNNFILGNRLYAPRIENIVIYKNYVICKINTCSYLKSNKNIYGFALAGEDKRYVVAEAKIVNKNTIKVYSNFINNPKYLTYAFSLYNDFCNVYDRDLPLLQYRHRVENASKYLYAPLIPAFYCSLEKSYDNAFSTINGGSRYTDSYIVSGLFGSKKAKIRYSQKGMLLSIKYDASSSCMVGVEPTIVLSSQRHRLDKYSKLSLNLKAEKELEMIGIHFLTSTGKRYFCLPNIKGVETRDFILKENTNYIITFNLCSLFNNQENKVILSKNERIEICRMQITFRNYQEENNVLIKSIIIHN